MDKSPSEEGKKASSCKTLCVIDSHVESNVQPVVCFSRVILHGRHEELLAKGGLYADMWLKQQQAQDSDSASDTEAKDRKSEKLQPPSATGGHPHGH